MTSISSRYPISGLTAPYAVAGSALTLWSGFYRASADAALWWAERWMQAPTFLSAWSWAREVSDAAFEPARAAVGEALTEITMIEQTPPQIVEVAAAAAEAAREESAAVIQVAAEPLKLVPEDLTQLVGIGPKLAAALAERGVTRFSHIAAWTATDLVELDKALDLKGRAVRDSWVAQAKRFAHQA